MPYFASFAQVVSLLDPTGRLFGGRVVSRCDSNLRHKETTSWLHRSLADDSMVLIGQWMLVCVSLDDFSIGAQRQISLFSMWLHCVTPALS